MPDPRPIRLRLSRVVRLSPFALEVVVTCDDAPWDRAAGVFNKRRDAENAAVLLEVANGPG